MKYLLLCVLLGGCNQCIYEVPVLEIGPCDADGYCAVRTKFGRSTTRLPILGATIHVVRECDR